MALPDRNYVHEVRPSYRCHSVMADTAHPASHNLPPRPTYLAINSHAAHTPLSSCTPQCVHSSGASRRLERVSARGAVEPLTPFLAVARPQAACCSMGRIGTTEDSRRPLSYRWSDTLSHLFSVWAVPKRADVVQPVHQSCCPTSIVLMMRGWLFSQDENWRQRLEFEVKTARLFPSRWGFMFVKPKTPSDSTVRLPLHYSLRRVASERLHTPSTVFSLELTTVHQHLRSAVCVQEAHETKLCKYVNTSGGNWTVKKKKVPARIKQPGVSCPAALSAASLGRGDVVFQALRFVE
jgi:hypothetical protein